MTATTEVLVVTEPGVYPMTADQYHADPVPGGSLSSSGARKLLPPSCPAVFHYEREHGQQPKRVFDLGHAAHRLVLGEGADIVEIPYDSYLTKAAKAERDAARFDGLTPLLTKEHEQVKAMADAIRQHPIAGPLFTPDSGVAEQALFWTDGPAGITRRALVDWTKHRGTGRLILADYKTTTDASLTGIAKAVAEHGYHQQAAWYIDGAIALDLGDQDTELVFVFQEKTAPYLVTVTQLTRDDIRRGREKNRRAIDIYANCTASGVWPAYHDGVAITSLPPWAQIRHDEEYS
ncbi:PD-(D/E)XK nuclease-like domain-containing protein [Streptomyces sp. NPDC056387]|uniref:PD-(D/E)XK nuclease-like domain-containing protein n=1 Tax=Streptomyces sp. NPDC056387 TaxID=3345803 RepID=UPI0035D79696